jgi:hypothetical protein
MDMHHTGVPPGVWVITGFKTLIYHGNGRAFKT